MDEEEVPFEDEVVADEEEVLPEPPPLKRSSKTKLQDRVECGDCGRQVSAHTLKFTHRCPAKKKREEAAAPAPEPEAAPAPKPKRAAKAKAAENQPCHRRKCKSP